MMTPKEATEYCHKTFGKDWWFHYQMLVLAGKVKEKYYNALEDRY